MQNDEPPKPKPVPPRRPAARPEGLPRAVAGDEQPERSVVRHPGLDGADQLPPARVSTLIGMPAAPRLDAPPLPPELAPRRAAPWGKTIQAPAPPSTVALARRTDPPPPESQPAPSEPATGHADALAELQRQLTEAQAQIDRLQRPAFPPPVSERPQVPPAPPVPTTLSPTSWSDRRILKAVLTLLGALVPLCSSAAFWLTARAYEAEEARRRLTEVAKEATATATSAREDANQAHRRIDLLMERLANREAYHRAILRRLGVEYPRHDGEPAEPVLTTQTPQRKPGAVGPQPVLVVTGPAPP